MKGLLLISGGIDSPVAGYLMMKRGVDIACIHFNNEPLTTSDSLKKSKKLVRQLCKIFRKKVNFYEVKHGRNLVEAMKNCRDRMRCVICRRIMLKISERVAKTEECDFLITGENLGQVASQTLDNMAVTDNAISIPVLRPILCNDKLETISLAKKIGTFELSIEPGMCCNAVPRHPVTHARTSIIENEERKMGINNVIADSLKDIHKEALSFS